MRVNRILKIILEKEGININNKTVSRHFVSRIEIKILNNKNRGVDK
ncbi:MAG: hypothetical protein LBD41_01555 [Clostridiales Family XIII bacterium]|jgi:ssRNA-specific RNase YbeY (16S rRNA maturation enzyme)|nr:hypothetical protein [Clostridiales Family XIII bacterium]